VYVWGDEQKMKCGQFAAGHSVRVLIPQVQAWSDHPFTVVSTGRLTAEGVATGRESEPLKKEGFLELLIKQEGGFTKELSELARKTSLDVEAAQVRRITDVGVILEGPYGHVSADRTFDRCQEARLYAGGIGVTFPLPMINRLVRREGSQTVCRLIWSVRDLGEYEQRDSMLVFD
jgi:predicted ferric reductase